MAVPYFKKMYWCLNLLILLFGTVNAADAPKRHKKTTSEPPTPSYSNFVSVYTSLTLVPVNPDYHLPYQPYPDTQGVNDGGLQASTVTDTIFIEASPVTMTVTESYYFTQFITVEPPIQQCLASVQIPQPPAGPQATQYQPFPSFNIPSSAAASTSTSNTDTGDLNGDSMNDSSTSPDDSSDSTTDSGEETTSKQRKSKGKHVSTSSSIYLPYISSATRRGFPV